MRKEKLSEKKVKLITAAIRVMNLQTSDLKWSAKYYVFHD